MAQVGSLVWELDMLQWWPKKKKKKESLANSLVSISKYRVSECSWPLLTPSMHYPSPSHHNHLPGRLQGSPLRSTIFHSCLFFVKSHVNQSTWVIPLKEIMWLLCPKSSSGFSSHSAQSPSPHNVYKALYDLVPVSFLTLPVTTLSSAHSAQATLAFMLALSLDHIPHNPHGSLPS